MDGTPKVSVIIATFNRAAFLSETLDSVMRQKFEEFEVIVVDDGSTDDTKEVVRHYGDRIRYVFQENRGPSAARNLGVRHARAPWLAIQDSDDLCTPDHLEVLYGYAREHSGCRMVFANGVYLGGREHNRETIIPAGNRAGWPEKGFGWSISLKKASCACRQLLFPNPPTTRWEAMTRISASAWTWISPFGC